MGSVRDVTRDLLREYGLTTVFGNPGTTEIPFLTDWPSDFRYVLGLQESVVVAMADGYAQAARQPVLVNLHSAGGVGHALGSLYTAHRNRSPLIIMAGQQTRSLLLEDPFLGATDAAEFPKPYVKWSCEPARAQDVPAALARAYHTAAQPPYGPVFVSVPADDWDSESPPVAARRALAGFAPDPKALAELADALSASASPAIVVGDAVDQDGAVDEVVALAEKVKAGVYVSPMSGRCSFPEDHPLFLGFLTPERIALAHSLAGHDLVVVVGAPAFTYHVYRGEPDIALPPMFVVSDDEQVLARAPHGTGIRSTTKPAVTQLAAAVSGSRAAAPAPLARPPRPAQTNPVSGGYVYSVLAELLPSDAIVVEEAPSHRNVLHDHLPITARDTGFLAAASGTLGWAVPAAVGAAVARPRRKVVCVVGDGSSMYSIQALWTAAVEQAPVTFVILDNTQYAAVRILGEAMGGQKLPGVDLGGIDFGELASAMGCSAYRAERPDELKPALNAALADPRPSLVHVRVDPSPERIY
ncbi:thiamine pyrophosphate-dependent enzyme, possible carboligase or decarboxylase [Saccharomonospora marina XMU15]|uniref:Thiamine pyrophosphate-dependent enzyme, possible carboligase or decarboxylase n=1 Tax=Saccharomonospora marina XMU15 TaxID=882083 RepID=H5WZ34_9PSEU|nr:benzoylformate decarboxylase [Saccharomonospora marina]EHR52968.1 thiamine pyrophosphate-dependent enzyme, possible carboligase or decarboxylase [Saccharomonospora marina XMU15]